MTREKTTIDVRTETWRRINERRQIPRDTLDDIITRLLDEGDQDRQRLEERVSELERAVEELSEE